MLFEQRSKEIRIRRGDRALVVWFAWLSWPASVRCAPIRVHDSPNAIVAQLELQRDARMPGVRVLDHARFPLPFHFFVNGVAFAGVREARAGDAQVAGQFARIHGAPPQLKLFSPLVIEEVLALLIFASTDSVLPLGSTYLHSIGQSAIDIRDIDAVATSRFRAAEAFDLDLRDDFVFEFFGDGFRHSCLS